MAIYWFTGQPGAGKSTIGKKLVELLETDRRNWRKPVFHIDGDSLRDFTNNRDYSVNGRIENIRQAQFLSNYVHSLGYDVVVTLVSPYRYIREEFKQKMGSDIVEIYIHGNRRIKQEFKVDDYEPPLNNFIDLNTSKESIKDTFEKLIHNLKNIDKI